MDETRQGQTDFIDWDKIRPSVDYINSVRAILRKRFDRNISDTISIKIFSLEDLKRFLEENNSTLTYNEAIAAADANYKDFMNSKPGEELKESNLN